MTTNTARDAAYRRIPVTPQARVVVDTVEYIDAHGLGLDGDDLEDRLIAAQCDVAASVAASVDAFGGARA